MPLILNNINFLIKSIEYLVTIELFISSWANTAIDFHFKNIYYISEYKFITIIY